MHFYATSAQIAHEFAFSHEDVMDTITKLPYPTSFKDENIQSFDLGSTQFAQLTEPGYSCVVMNLPLNAGGDDDLVLKWRAQFFFNKSPSVQSLMAPQQEVTTVTSGKAAIKTQTTTSEVTRRQAEEMISSGACDGIINEPFASIHREIRNQLNDDPGYQNVRIYATQRRNAIAGKA